MENTIAYFDNIAKLQCQATERKIEMTEGKVHNSSCIEPLVKRNDYKSLFNFKFFNYAVRIKHNSKRMLFSDRHFKRFELFNYWIIIINHDKEPL